MGSFLVLVLNIVFVQWLSLFTFYFKQVPFLWNKLENSDLREENRV